MQQNFKMAVLEATQNGTGVTIELLKRIQDGYKRLYRKTRNRSDHWYAESYKAYAENSLDLMG